MSAIVARRWRRVAIVGSSKAQQFLSGGGGSLSNSWRPRQFSTASVLPKKPLDGIDKIFIGSACFIGGTIAKVYYDFFEENNALEAKHHKEATEEHEEAPVPDHKAEVEKAYQEHLKLIEAKYEEELKEAEKKVSENEARAKQLEKELENETAKHASELKSQADMIASKLQEEIQALKEEANAKQQTDEAGKDRLRLVNEITELKRQIESLGLSGSDLDKSYVLKKLATVMGVFAFENAMLNGEPLQKEVEFLHGGDPLIDAAVSSLPQEAVREGSWTPLQLQSKFVESKPTIRELILVPSTGGGTVSHLIARGASNLKVKEENPEEGDIESVLDQVENLMKDGKLVEAAAILEQRVEGTEAQTLVTEWAKQARLRSAVEEVHNVLRAHAASISMSLA